MKVLVTGAAGRLGRAACLALREAGHYVRGTDQRYERDVADEFRLADLRDRIAVYTLVEGMDAVAHLGNYPNIGVGVPPPVIYAENIAMNTHVFHAAIDVGVTRIMFASSIQAISSDRDVTQNTRSSLSYLPLDGDAPPAPSNLYGLSKVAGEELLRFYAGRHPGLAATAVRFPYLIAGGSHWRPGRKHREVRPGIRLDEGFTYLFFTDAGRLIVDIVERQQPGYHQYLPSATTPSIAIPVPDLIRDHFAGVELRKPPEEMTSLVDISRITRDLGWEPRERLPLEDDPVVAAQQ